MNENKIIDQIKQKIKCAEEKGNIVKNSFNDGTLTKELDKLIKIKSITGICHNNNGNKENSKIFNTRNVSKNKNKIVDFGKVPVNLKLQYDLSSLSLNELKIKNTFKRNSITTIAAGSNNLNNLTFNTNKVKKNKIVNLPSNINNDILFVINEPTIVMDKPFIHEKIIVKTMREFENLEGIKFYCNKKFQGLNSNEINFNKIILPDFFPLNLIKRKNKFLIDTIEKKIEIYPQVINNGLGLIQPDEYQFNKFKLSYIFLKQFLKLEERGLKLKKFFSNSEFANFEIENKTVTEFDLKPIKDCNINNIIYKIEAEKYFKKVDNILNKNLTINNTKENLNFIFSEFSSNIYVDNFKKIQITTSSLDINKKTNQNTNSNLIINNKHLKCVNNLNFIPIENFQPNFKKIKTKKISLILTPSKQNNSNNLSLQHSTNKRKYSEMIKSHTHSTQNNTQPIIFNQANLKLKFDSSKIRDLTDYLQNKNIIFMPLDEKKFFKLLNNIDIIMNINSALIIVVPEDFSDEYDFKSFDNLTKTIHENYLSYQKITIAIDNTKSLKNRTHTNKIKNLLEDYLNKKFSEILKNFDTELFFFQFYKLSELCEFVYTNSINNANIENINSILVNLINAKTNNLNIGILNNLFSIFPFLNFMELYLISNIRDITNQDSEEIIFLIKKYIKKKIKFDYSLLLNN